MIEEREEFIRLALQPGANKRELCERFEIDPSTGHKWLGRYRKEGDAGLQDRSRRPRHSPTRTGEATEAAVLGIRDESNNAWGARKIARVMEQRGFRKVPALSTITEILRRHGRLEERQHEHPGAVIRFEREQPNELWQMDFKGHFAIGTGRCHPLTILDDHSRYSLGLEACSNEQEKTVRERLTDVFRRYGLPFAMLTDNGSPWGDSNGGRYTLFSVWLMRLGIRISHGRAFHPQTQGKDERFHRTLKAEVLHRRSFSDIAECQRAFDRWRGVYNFERPHEAVGLNPPVTRYRPSKRCFPDQLPEIVYWPGDAVRKVDGEGFISFKNRLWRIGKPFRRQPVALRSTPRDGCFDVVFCDQTIGRIDLRQASADGFVDIAPAMPTTPQPQHQLQS